MAEVLKIYFPNLCRQKYLESLSDKDKAIYLANESFKKITGK